MGAQKNVGAGAPFPRLPRAFLRPLCPSTAVRLSVNRWPQSPCQFEVRLPLCFLSAHAAVVLAGAGPFFEPVSQIRTEIRIAHTREQRRRLLRPLVAHY